MKTPESILPYEADYKTHAWEQYTFAELGQWVHLLATRFTHRVPGPKRDKDFYDAQNYLAMMQAKLDALKELSFDPSK